MIGSEEVVLFDTNVLVFAHDTRSPNFERARQLQELVNEGKLKVAISAQNLLEFYSSTTNPHRAEQILGHSEATIEVNKYLISRFDLILPKGDELNLILALIREKKIIGRKIFDVYLVATMLSNGINTIYTHNEKDFTMFKEVKVINPFKL